MSGPILDLAVPAVIDGPIELSFALEPPVDVDVVSDFRQLLGDVLMIAEHGAFVAQTHHPTASTLRLVHEQPNPTGFSLHCEASKLDHRFVRVVRNLCIMYSKVMHSVRSFGARAQGARPVGLIALDPDAIAAAYPPRSDKLAFPIQISDEGEYRGPRCAEIQFTGTLEDTVADEVIALFVAWGNASLGGYTRSEAELSSGDCAIFDVDPDLRDSATIEVPIAMFGAPSCAWDPFLNLCGTLNRTRAGLRVVEIG